MLLTEDEAQKKICPIMARPITRLDHFHQKIVSVFPVYCCGAACMGWRWEKGCFILSKDRFAEDDETFSSKDFEMRSTGRGYCGLVGAPS